MNKEKTIIFIIGLFFLALEGKVNACPPAGEIVKSLKSNNLYSWCEVVSCVKYLGNEAEAEEAKKALLDLGTRLFIKGDNPFKTTKDLGEWGECQNHIYREIGLLKDDRAIPILLAVGNDGAGYKLIAYFGEKTVENFIDRTRKAGDPNYLGPFVDPEVPKKYPLSQSSINKIRNISLEVLNNEKSDFKSAAIYVLGKIANPDDIPLIEEISKEDQICFEKQNPVEKVGDKYMRVNKPKTICPVRETAAKALEEIKARNNNVRSVVPYSVAATGQVQPKINILEEKKPIVEEEKAGTKLKNMNIAILIGVIVAIAILLSVIFVLVRRQHKT